MVGSNPTVIINGNYVKTSFYLLIYKEKMNFNTMEIAKFVLKNVECDVFLQIPCCPNCGNEIILEQKQGRCEKCQRIYIVIGESPLINPYAKNIYFKRKDTGEEI